MFHVDVAAGRFDIERITSPTAPGVAHQALEQSHLIDVSVAGPGTFDGTSRVLADVRITNGLASALNEPYMQVVSVSDPTIVFEGIDSGDGGVGSVYAYADLDVSGGVNAGSAFQSMSILDPDTSTTFSFSVDIFADADAPAAAIFPDADDDSYNREPSQPAGDDCDDTDPAKNPGGLTCALECGVCGVDVCNPGGCCAAQCVGTDVCTLPCTAGCACDLGDDPTVRNSTYVDCAPGSACYLECLRPTYCGVRDCDAANCQVDCTDNSGADCETDICRNGAHCDLNCTAVRRDCEVDECVGGSVCDVECSGGGRECQMRDCDASTCLIDCVDNPDNCQFEDCANGAYCDLTCSFTASPTAPVGTCDIDNCSGSECHVTCGPDDDSCFITTCTSASTCSVTCDDADSQCLISDCSAGSTCDVTCSGDAALCGMRCDGTSSCRLDCTAQTSGNCLLSCNGGPPLTCPSGVLTCDLSDC